MARAVRRASRGATRVPDARRMLYAVRCATHGVQRTLYVVGHVVYGYDTAYDVWRIKHGVRCIVYDAWRGVWCMAYLVWCTMYGV
eukprot:5576965-Lingulodinium_polyedra.AAC.1